MARRRVWLVAIVALTLGLVVALIFSTSGGTPELSLGSSVIPASERLQLTNADAFSTRPIRFLLFGDSIALTLAIGLSYNSERNFGVRVINGGVLGCDLDNLPVIISGSIGPATPGCPHWRTTWPKEILRYDPKVVGLLVGRWDVTDHYFDGRWVHVGESVWDDHVESELRQAVQLFSARGAKVVLFTMPFVNPPQLTSSGSPYPENTPERAAAFNRLEYEVEHSDHTVKIVNLNAMLDPAGHYQSMIGNIPVRWSDGVHITEAAGQWLQSKILPEIAELGLEARTLSTPTEPRTR